MPARHVVVDDVGPSRRAASAISWPRGVLEVERDVALAALAPEERLGREAHAVAGDRLDLDDVGAEVAEDHRAERPGEVLAEVDDGARLRARSSACTARERRDLGVGVAELAEDLALCCPARGRGPWIAAGRAEQVDRHADLVVVAELGIVDLATMSFATSCGCASMPPAPSCSSIGHDRLDRVVVRLELGDELVALVRWYAARRFGVSSRAPRRQQVLIGSGGSRDRGSRPGSSSA